MKTRKVQITRDIVFNEDNKDTDFSSMNGMQMVKDQQECSSSREVEEPKVMEELESMILKMATKIIGDDDMEYERF